VQYPFGYGLSYASFEYTDLTVNVPDPTAAYASVDITLRNTSDRAGSEVVQVYVDDEASSVDRPNRELKGFTKVRLEAGEQRTIRIELDERAFAYWGTDGWTVEPGEFTISAGPHSRDLPLAETITLNVPAPVAALDWDSTLNEWLAHPVGAPVLTSALSSMGDAADALTNEEALPLFGSMPLRTILSFAEQASPDTVDANDALTALLAHAQPS
jgi:beta-glucosidase